MTHAVQASCLAALFMVTATSSAVAQGGALDAATPNDELNIVTIQGCLEGVILTSTDLTESIWPGLAATMGDRFRVVGDKELLDELRAFNGHVVEIIGVLREQRGRTQRAGRGKRVGEQTFVWIGGGTRAPNHPNPFSGQSLPESGQAGAPAEIEMRAVVPVNGTCPIV